MVFGCDRGRGRGREFGGRGSLEVVVVLMVVDRMLLIKGPGDISIAGGITTSLRSAEISSVALWAHLADADIPVSGDIAHIQAPSANHSVLLALSLLFYHMKNMIDCVSLSSLRTVI